MLGLFAFAANQLFDYAFGIESEYDKQKRLEEEWYKKEYADKGRKDTLTSYTEYDRDIYGRIVGRRTYKVNYK